VNIQAPQLQQLVQDTNRVNQAELEKLREELKAAKQEVL
jgi:hypothetical protein